MDIHLTILCRSPEHPAGSEKTVRLLASGLPEHGIGVRVLLPREGPFTEQLRAAGVEVARIGGGQRPTPRAVCELRRSLREHPPDVVQLHLSRFFAPFLPRGVPVVERLNMTRHERGWYPLRWKWLDRTTARWIDRFVVVSDSLREQFIARGYPSEKLTRIYSGVRIPQHQPESSLREELGIGDDVPLVGTMGRLTAQKGMDLFLLAVARVRERFPAANFALVGEGELRHSLEHQARELGLNDCVHFTGWREDSAAVLASFDVLLYPSAWEPFANTILEAMAVGTPVVASNVGGHPEAVRDGRDGLLFASGDSQAAAEAVGRLLADPELVARISASARCRAAEFSADRMVSEHADAYRSVFQQSASP